MERKELKAYEEYDEEPSKGFPPHLVYDKEEADAVMDGYEARIKELEVTVKTYQQIEKDDIHINKLLKARIKELEEQLKEDK